MAGGKSTRMGRDKAELTYRGMPLWEFQVKKLKSFAGEILISTREGALDALRGEYRIILDDVPGLGPLGGLHQALKTAAFDHVLLFAVDMPAMTAGYLRSLAASVAPGMGLVPEFHGFYQGLAAVYPRSILPLVEANLAGSDRSFQNLNRQATAQGLMRALPVQAGEESLFENWNSPEDVS